MASHGSGGSGGGGVAPMDALRELLAKVPLAEEQTKMAVRPAFS